MDNLISFYKKTENRKRYYSLNPLDSRRPKIFGV